MQTIHEKLRNRLTLARDTADLASLGLLFPELHDCPDPYILSLRPYLKECPSRFFDQNVYALMRDWLKECDIRQRDKLREYLESAETELNQAILFLRQVNAEDWHDRILVPYDDYELVRFIDKQLHPAYLRLVEGVLTPLLRPVAHFSRIDRGKKPDGLDVYNVVKELSTTVMAPCVGAYHHTVRNGIGHGGITYMMSDIRYRDKMGNEETLDTRSLVRLCDDMLDICNGLASAFKCFMILSRDRRYRLPREFLVEELIEETYSPWWKIEGCVELELGHTRQLIIYARPNSRDFNKILLASLQSAVMAEYFVPGYDRYFLSLRSPKTFPGSAAFNGKELKRLRESAATEIADYKDALEKPGLFYLPRPALPRFLSRLETLLQSFHLHWPLATDKIRVQLGIPNIVSRNTHIHRNGWSFILSGAVVIEGLTNESAVTTIRAQKDRIIYKAVQQARSMTSWFDPVRYLPLGYARIGVYAKDFRCRRLESFGLGPELICTIQLQHIRRIKSPDIRGSTIEGYGNWRIAWNRAWIEAGGRIRPPAHSLATRKTG